MSENVGDGRGQRHRGRQRALRRVGGLRGGGTRAVPLPRRRADRGAAHGNPRAPRLVRAVQRRRGLRGRVAQGHRQPVQGPGARQPHCSASPRPSTKKASSTTASTDLSPVVPEAVADAPAMVDWALAQRVAAGALILKPAPASYRSRDLQGQFDDLTARAETLVSEATGLHSAHGTARAKVTDRAGWAAANVRSVERLMGPAMVELQRKRQQARRAVPGGGPCRRRDPARPHARLHGDARSRAVRPADQ